MNNEKLIEKICNTDRPMIIASMLRNILHDINSPLTGMDMNFKTLSYFIESCETQWSSIKGSVTDPAITDFVENDLSEVLSDINTGFDKVTSMMKNLNIMSSRPSNYIADKINLNEVIENCLTLIHNKIKQTSLETNFDDCIQQLKTDLCKLENLILNLLLDICAKISVEKKPKLYINTLKNDSGITMIIGHNVPLEQEFCPPTDIPFPNIKVTLEIRKNIPDGVEYIVNLSL